MTKIVSVGSGIHVLWCPGCQKEHRFDVHALNADGRVMGWDGDRVAPSVDSALTYDRCSFTLRGGVMRFDLACDHHLAGREVLLPTHPTGGIL